VSATTTPVTRSTSGGSCVDDAWGVGRGGDVVATVPPNFHLLLNYVVQAIVGGA
jgi:hypothetical protein